MQIKTYLVVLCAMVMFGCEVIPFPPHPPTTTTTTTIPPVIDKNHPETIHTANGTVQWDNLAETCKILEYTFDASGFWSRNQKNPAWQTVSPDNPQDGFIVLVWLYDNVWQGEYWDCGVNIDYKYVSLNHITDPTSPFAGRLPKTGDKVGNMFVSWDGKYRSNIAWGNWPL